MKFLSTLLSIYLLQQAAVAETIVVNEPDFVVESGNTYLFESGKTYALHKRILVKNVSNVIFAATGSGEMPKLTCFLDEPPLVEGPAGQWVIDSGSNFWNPPAIITMDGSFIDVGPRKHYLDKGESLEEGEFDYDSYRYYFRYSGEYPDNIRWQTGQNPCFRILESSNISIVGLNMQFGYAAIDANDVTNLFLDIEAKNFARFGIRVTDSTVNIKMIGRNFGQSGIVARGNISGTIHDSSISNAGSRESVAGIYLGGVIGDLQIFNNEVRQVFYGNYFADGDGIYLDHGSQSSYGVRVINNQVYNIQGACFRDNTGGESVWSNNYCSGAENAFRLSNSDEREGASIILTGNSYNGIDPGKGLVIMNNLTNSGAEIYWE